MPTHRGQGSHSRSRSSSSQRRSSSVGTAKDNDLCPCSSSSGREIVLCRRASPRYESPCRPANLSDSKVIIEEDDDARHKKTSKNNKKSKTQHKQRRSGRPGIDITDHPSSCASNDEEEQQRPKLLQDSYLDDTWSSSSSSSTQDHQTFPQQRRRRTNQLQKHINNQAAKIGCFKAIILCYTPRKNKDDSPPHDEDEEEFDIPAPFLPSAVDSMYTPDHSSLEDRIESERLTTDKLGCGQGNLLRRALSSTPTSRRFKGERMGTKTPPRRRDFSGPMTFGGGNSSTPSPNSTELLRSNTSGRRSPPPIMFSTSSGLLKPPQVEFRLQCTLEELCFGCVKQVTVSRHIVVFSGQMSQKEEVMMVNVEPGWTKGTKIKFSGSGGSSMGTTTTTTTTTNTEDAAAAGDGGVEMVGYYSSDVVFVVTEKEHEFLKRSKTNDEDLEMEIKVSLIDALTGCDLSIPLLGDGQRMCLQIYDIVTPGYEKVIRGQGMPTRKDPARRGDLRVKFKVEFPDKLEDSKRSEISKILLLSE